MKIGVISDTHIPVSATELPEKVREYFKGCDLIIHAGDIVEKSVLDKLGKIAETRAVCGNMDSAELRQILPERLVLDAAGKKIGVTHGSGPHFKVMESAKKSFKDKPDVIIFGHSHGPVNEMRDGTLFFNPGSATDKVFAKYRSFGIIEITGDDIRGEIIRIDD
jgi:putative phosphoesterase